jgi:hypothetical protein
MINCGQRLLTQKLKPGRLFNGMRVIGGIPTLLPGLPGWPILRYAIAID